MKKTKRFSKLNLQEQKEVLKAKDYLITLIEDSERNGVPFEKIFNNDKIKHNCLGNDYYTFKAISFAKTQMRIMYKFIRLDNGKFDIELHLIYIKRRDDNSYLQEFKDYAMR